MIVIQSLMIVGVAFAAARASRRRRRVAMMLVLAALLGAAGRVALERARARRAAGGALIGAVQFVVCR